MKDLLGGLSWLEIGSGVAPMPGYCHLDMDPGAPHVEIHADASDIPLADCTVERIYSCHALEHFSQFDVIPVLREWWRVLKVGGEIEIHVPDFEIVSAAFLNETDLGRRMEIAHTILGLHQHRSIFDLAMLKTCMEAAGFVDVHEIEGWDRHDAGWRHVIPDGWSLKVVASK